VQLADRRILVISQCGLEKDLELLELGDDTEGMQAQSVIDPKLTAYTHGIVGEKGVNLRSVPEYRTYKFQI
jgi:hypothetical protein